MSSDGEVSEWADERDLGSRGEIRASSNLAFPMPKGHSYHRIGVALHASQHPQPTLSRRFYRQSLHSNAHIYELGSHPAFLTAVQVDFQPFACLIPP